MTDRRREKRSRIVAGGRSRTRATWLFVNARDVRASRGHLDARSRWRGETVVGILAGLTRAFAARLARASSSRTSPRGSWPARGESRRRPPRRTSSSPIHPRTRNDAEVPPREGDRARRHPRAHARGFPRRRSTPPRPRSPGGGRPPAASLLSQPIPVRGRRRDRLRPRQGFRLRHAPSQPRQRREMPSRRASPVPPPTRRRTGHRRTLRHPEVRARVPTPPVRGVRESRPDPALDLAGDGVWISAHPSIGEKLVAELLRRGAFDDRLRAPVAAPSQERLPSPTPPPTSPPPVSRK